MSELESHDHLNRHALSALDVSFLRRQHRQFRDSAEPAPFGSDAAHCMSLAPAEDFYITIGIPESSSMGRDPGNILWPNARCFRPFVDHPAVSHRPLKDVLALCSSSHSVFLLPTVLPNCV